MAELGILKDGLGSFTKHFTGNLTFVSFFTVLIWLILFHMLVGGWVFIIIFTCLVAVGGWLGSHAVLNLENKVYLEKFIRLSSSPQSPDSETQLAEEVNSTIKKIIRDFVSSWYKTVSSDPLFEQEVQCAMQNMAKELKRRMELVDKKALAQKVLLLCGCHLNCFIEAKDSVTQAKQVRISEGLSHSIDSNVWQAYSKTAGWHWALQSPAMEIGCARAIVDLLLHVLVPRPHLETLTGRFVVGELITCNVLLPLITKLSDPDWINLILIHIISRTSKKGEPEVPEQLQQPQIPNSLPLKVHVEPLPEIRLPTPDTAELLSYDVVDSVECLCQEADESKDEFSSDFSADTISSKERSFSMEYVGSDTLKTLFPCEDLELESPVCDIRDCESLVLLPAEVVLDAVHDSLVPRFGVIAVRQDASGNNQAQGCTDMSPSLPCSAGSSQNSWCLTSEHFANAPDLKGEGIVSSVVSKSLPAHPEMCVPAQTSFIDKMVLPFEALPIEPLEPDSVGPLQTSSPTSAATESLASFAFEPLSSPDIPVVIQNMRITGTITAREHRGTGFHPYTLYTIKYETAVDSENPGMVQQVAYHTVNRRYSEFLNLQTRLEEKPDLRKLIKHVKGPKKLFPDLPFGNMDTEKVENRKVLLESFLQQLCIISEIANSEEMQEFLALNTDARIAFVKKPFVVSLIDKMAVNAIVDTLKTAFPRSEPQSPTDDMGEGEVDGKKLPKSKLRFSSKISPAASVSNVPSPAIYCYDSSSSVVEGFSVAGLKTFIQEQEQQLLDHSLEQVPVVKLSIATAASDSEANEVHSQEQSAENHRNSVDSDTALADVALDLLCLVTQKHWSYLCGEKLQQTIRMVFGTLIDRWLEEQTIELLCMQRWILYLQDLQEAIWPGGSLPAQPKPVRTQEQKEKAHEQALQCLMEIVPGWITKVFCADKCRQTSELILQSLQDPVINRHLVYCLWDILLEFLIPECSDKGFHDLILSRLSGKAEKGGV